ncbi:R-linalool synthase [Heracleum sosnowskyi]|uniref:R-linalool synthase n=1 Tax=Heracleum sosnowskyi TaxID=360622 RepID=A0AAD8J4C9_9APIA|nr:R-linalool synthase [Heracleum sosnowskyi]
MENATAPEETLAQSYLVEHAGQSILGLFIFLVIFAFQFSSKYLAILKKVKGSTSAADAQLRAEIKQLYKEASTLSQPSTFAQAAKLRRTAAAKEKELAKNQEVQSKEISSSFDDYSKKLMLLKIFTYVVFTYWFWGSPVAAIPYQLVQPFGRFLSWRSGGYLNDYVMVGIIQWLTVSTSVAKFACQQIFKF